MAHAAQSNRRSRSAITLVISLVLQTPTLAQTPSVPARAPTPVEIQDSAPTSAPPVIGASATPSGTALPAAAPPLEPNTLSSVLQLPRNLSPWGMFLSADIVVKAVMIGLALASLVTWTIWFAKMVELMVAQQRLRAAIGVLGEGRSFVECLKQMRRRVDATTALMQAAEGELRLSAGGLDPVGVKERIALKLERLEAAAGRQMMRGTGILATVGATAPFVGLFGTVWGIMNSFIGISKQHTTNLAVVAPGIAEALLATALGLVAAIPAVVMYNMLSRRITNYRAQQGDAAAEILRLVSRDLDRGGTRTGERLRPAPAAE
jgi:biopolymer transport protein ExbB